MTAGSGDGSGVGGTVNITAGGGGGTNVNGSNVVINGGTKGGTATDGNVLLASSRGSVGIGTANPTAKLFVSSSSNGDGIVFNNINAGNSFKFTDYNDGSPMFYLSGVDNTVTTTINSTGPLRITAGGSSPASVNSKDLIFGNNTTGYVGINTTSPRSSLDINGTILMKPAISNATSTVDFTAGNIQYTNSNCGAFNLHSMKDGGTYTFVVKGTTSATCSFNAYSDAGITALTFHMPPDHGATTATKHTFYTFMVVGTDVYASWITGY